MESISMCPIKRRKSNRNEGYFLYRIFVHRKNVVIAIISIATTLTLIVIRSYPQSNLNANTACLASFGKYRGKQYTSSISTIGQPKCLIESKWMKLMQHSVQTESQGDQHIIHDWLFIDYHDRINVLVQDHQNVKQFIIFNQTKYSLEGRYSLAVVGGIIEPNETSETAARREVKEEMELECNHFQLLGRFRTDVNRGMGWVYSYLATDCYTKEQNSQLVLPSAQTKRTEEVGTADTEHQNMLSITIQKLRQHVLDGDFVEVQWSNTVALALLYLQVE